MKTIIFILMLQATIVALAQTPAKISDSQRKKILQLTDQALEKWAPGYNRHYGTPTIEYPSYNDKELYIRTYNKVLMDKIPEELETYAWVAEVVNGRIYYIVTYQFDKTVEVFRNSYAAKVLIWADNLKVFGIRSGNMWTLFNLDKPETKSTIKALSPHVPQKPPKKFIIKGTGNEPDKIVVTNQY